MCHRIVPLLLLAITITACAGPPPEVLETLPRTSTAPRKASKWNLSSKVALGGYDPVSYRAEDGGKPVKGDRTRAVGYGSVIYLFANDENLAAFRKDPARYEPSHGGWCSYAMRAGDCVGVDPETVLIRDDRLFLFYNSGDTDTLALWQQGDHASQLETADRAWDRKQR